MSVAKPKLPTVDIVDFETKPIQPAPQYPPVPVGVSHSFLPLRASIACTMLHGPV